MKLDAVSPTLNDVGVIVVHFGDERLTMRCVQSIVRSQPAGCLLRVVVVDNGSTETLRERLEQSFPGVAVRNAGGNIGFGAACNLGFDLLETCASIALVNNDAEVTPGWLEPLLEVIASSEDIGAAVPKVLLRGKFLDIGIAVEARRQGPDDPRSLGVQLHAVVIDQLDVTEDVHFVHGFWGWEHASHGRFTWTSGDAAAKAPCGPHPSEVELQLSCALGPIDVELHVGPHSVVVPVDETPRWHRVQAAMVGHPLVNSTGTELRTDFTSQDRGYLHADDGSFDVDGEVFGWSGAAVLLRRAYLEDVGRFDERLFLYYEDVDLSLRGRSRGWKYHYVHRSVVLHDHSAATKHQSNLVRHLLPRNRLVTLIKNAPLDVVLREVSLECLTIARTLHRDLLLPSLRGRSPDASHATARLKVLAGFLRMLPASLRERRRTTMRAISSRSDFQR